jgi:hypothetical protein
MIIMLDRVFPIVYYFTFDTSLDAVCTFVHLTNVMINDVVVTMIQMSRIIIAIAALLTFAAVANAYSTGMLLCHVTLLKLILHADAHMCW